MKCCKLCGRTGTAMRYSPRSVFSRPPAGDDEWACRNLRACNGRAAQLGKWVGTRVLRRRDRDGTCWTIRPLPGSTFYTLMCEYRQHRAMSTHFTIEAAKAHRDDLMRSWEARTMREYTGGRA